MKIFKLFPFGLGPEESVNNDLKTILIVSLVILSIFSLFSYLSNIKNLSN